MERSRPGAGPRANRSKRTLPAAFFAGGGAGAGFGAGSEAVVVTRSDPQAALSGELAPPPAAPPLDPGGRGVPLDSLVFLSSCPQRHGHCAMKKMLHPPSLSLFCLVEIPGGDHQRELLRAALQDWLGRWRALQLDHPDLLVEVCDAYWDAPQGYPMGVLCEYMPLGSLDELVSACGGLPEEAMREVAQVILEGLDALHSASPPMVHGFLKPSQVLFGVSGRPKLTFGLEQRLKGAQLWSPLALGSPGRAAAAPAVEQSAAVDIFDLGLLLLVSALGGLDVLLDAIPYARELAPRTAAEGRTAPAAVDTCALLQHELWGAFQAESGVEAASGSDMGYLPPASDLLFNRRYSGPFLSFVTTCLEGHTAVSARDLLRHEFLREPSALGPLVSLREMQGLARLLNEAPEHDPSRFGPAKSAQRALVPGVAPSVAQSAQMYLVNIAQSVAQHCGGRLRQLAAEHGEASPVAALLRWRPQEWETLLVDTSRTLGLSRAVVQDALLAQLGHLLHAWDKRRLEGQLMS